VENKPSTDPMFNINDDELETEDDVITDPKKRFK